MWKRGFSIKFGIKNPAVSEELSSVETSCTIFPYLTLVPVSEELSSVETRKYIRLIEQGRCHGFQKNLVVWKHIYDTKYEDEEHRFQKNLVVWKHSARNTEILGIYTVSEELSSVETRMVLHP